MKLVLLLSLFAVGCRAQEEAGSKPEEGAEGADGEKSKRDIVAQYSYCQEDNCYELLDVTKESKMPAIKRKYRHLAAEWHPDKNPDPRAKEIFQKYANAYEVLSNPEVRRRITRATSNLIGVSRCAAHATRRGARATDRRTPANAPRAPACGDASEAVRYRAAVSLFSLAPSCASARVESHFEHLHTRDAQMRSNYDYLLAHPYEFPMFFMRYSKPKYMPKSDLRFVLILTLVVMSAMQYLLKQSQ